MGRIRNFVLILVDIPVILNLSMEVTGNIFLNQEHDLSSKERQVMFDELP